MGARALCLATALAALASPASASAALAYGGHLDAALGYGTGQPAGFRANLDFGVHFGPKFDTETGGLFDTGSGFIVGVDGALGFRDRFPVDLVLEAGFVKSNGVAGIGVAGGPALRVNPSLGGGFEVRVFGDILFVEVGVKLSAIFGGGSEVQILGVVGFGFTLL